MSIITDLQTILTARYGKDVRQSIHDAIKTCYDDGKATILSASKVINTSDTFGSIASKVLLNRVEGNTVQRESEIVITQQPVDAVGDSGTSIPFSIEAIGKGLTYKWQWARTGDTSWRDSSSQTATTPNYSFAAGSGDDGDYVRCLVTDASGKTVASDIARVTLTGYVGIVEQPLSATVKLNDYVSFSVKARGEGLTYQWQYFYSGLSDWQNATAYEPTFTFKATNPTTHNGMQFRCVVTNSTGQSVTSEVATCHIGTEALSITSQPQNVIANSGETCVFTVVATGSNISYKWQYMRKGENVWIDSTTAASSTPNYNLGMRDVNDGMKVRCKITDSYGSVVYSDIVEGRMPHMALHSVGDKYACVDLGDLDWTYTLLQAGSRFTSGTNVYGLPLRAVRTADVYCPIYETINDGRGASSLPNMSIYNQGNLEGIAIIDSRYTNANDFKKAMKGIYAYFVYESTPSNPTKYCLPIRENGANLWDEQWEAGSLDYSGNPTTSSTDIRSKNFVPVKSNTTYFAPGGMKICFYDETKMFNGNFITTSKIPGTLGTAFTTPSNTSYLKFSISGTTYNNDIFIIKGTNGKYVPYEEPNTVFIPLSQPLCKVSDIKDRLVMRKDGTGYIEYNTLNPSEVVELTAEQLKAIYSLKTFDEQTTYEAVCDCDCEFEVKIAKTDDGAIMLIGFAQTMINAAILDTM